MRNVASPLLLVVWTAVISPAAGAYENESPVGKKPEPEVVMTLPVKTDGVLEETPNQRRRRLGMPIVASFPSPDYGELLETPNQMKRRLGQATAASYPLADATPLAHTP